MLRADFNTTCSLPKTSNSSRYLLFRKLANYWLLAPVTNCRVSMPARWFVELTNDRASGQSRKPETGEKNRQHKGDGHSKKPPSFHNAGVSIIHLPFAPVSRLHCRERCPCAIVPPVGLRSQGMSDRSPNVKGRGPDAATKARRHIGDARPCLRRREPRVPAASCGGGHLYVGANCSLHRRGPSGRDGDPGAPRQVGDHARTAISWIKSRSARTLAGGRWREG